MNILIEDAESLEFLNNNGQWTKNVGEGKNFATTHTAYDIAKKEPIRKFNIVRYFAGTKQFVNMDHGSGKGKATD
ncbi:MAG: hypothetical protein JWQ71_4333 [Pedosphaera sp.]|nr:hypothetical protein [Pedosphaera sp.]